jgi:two-component system, NtrC family, nitrogen regulation response regulator GlnG
MSHATDDPEPRAEPPLLAVVDDDADIRDMLEGALTEAGYRPLLIAQSIDAASVLRHAQPALVILDLWMERIDSGVQLLQALHTTETTRAVPVIVASAHPFMRPELDELLREPHYVFVQKPFPIEALLDTIATLLGPRASLAAPPDEPA